MNCDQALEAISAALDGELSAKERTLLDAHLADCPTCAALFDELAGQSRLLRQLDCQIPEDLTARILSQLPEQITPARRFSPRRWQRWGTVAACAVLVFWAGLALPLRESNPANLEPWLTIPPWDMIWQGTLLPPSSRRMAPLRHRKLSPTRTAPPSKPENGWQVFWETYTFCPFLTWRSAHPPRRCSPAFRRWTTA